MSLDTRNKRASAIGFALAFRLIAPEPNGSLASRADHAQLAYSYAGVLPVPETTDPIIARPPYFAPQVRREYDGMHVRTQLATISRAIPPILTRTVVADTIIAATDDTILCDTTAGDINVELLPAFQVQFLKVTIKNIGANTVTIAGLVDDQDGLTLAQYEQISIQSDGIVWHQIDGARASRIGYGDGSPEGSVPGRIGYVYARSDTTIGTSPLWVKATDSGDTGWRQLKLDDQVFCPLDYMQPTDTDHGNAVDLCFADAGAVGGVVDFAQAEYTVAATYPGWTVPSNVLVYGRGQQTFFNVTPLPGAALFNVLAGSSHIGFQNFRIGGTMACGILVDDSTQVSFENIDVSGCTVPSLGTGYASGVAIHRSTDILFQRCRFHDNGLVTDSGALTADIQIGGLFSAESSRVRILNTDCISTAVHYNIECYNVADSVVDGCEITGAYCRTADNTGYGIVFYHTTLAAIDSVRNIRIAKCYLHDLEGCGIYIQGGLNTVVSQCIFERVASVQTDVTLLSSAVGINGGSNPIVSSCIIDDSGQCGIEFANVEDVMDGGTAVGNQIRNTASYAIRLRGSATGLVISNNDIASCAGGVINDLAPYLLTDATISNNRISDSGSGILLLTAVGCSVSGNTVRLSDQHGIRIGAGIVTATVNGAGAGIGATSIPIATLGGSLPSGTVLTFTGGKVATLTALATSVATSLTVSPLVAGVSAGNVATFSGTDNHVDGNIVLDSSQSSAGTYADIYVTIPYTTCNNNQTRTTLTGGAGWGVLFDATAVTGSEAIGNSSFGHSVLDFSFPDGLSAGGNTETSSAGRFSVRAELIITGSPTEGTQLDIGDTSDASSISTLQSFGDMVIAFNARQTHTTGAWGDAWHQNLDSESSSAMRMGLSGDVTFYAAASSSADDDFAGFWGSAIATLSAAGALSIIDVYKVAGTQVVGSRKTGWSAMTGTADRAAHATYDGDTAGAGYDQTKTQAIMDALKIVSQRLKGTGDDLISHGLIGT